MEYFDPKILGSRLRSLRTVLRLTQEQMAKELGVSRHSILNYEKGGKIPPRKFILSLVRTYNINEEWFLHGYEPMFPPPHKDREYDIQKEDESLILKSAMNKSVESAPRESQINIKDLTYKTIEILASNTIYRAALASNINAFYHSIKMAEDLSSVKTRVDHVEESDKQTKDQIKELAQTIKDLQEENRALKGRRSSGGDPSLTDAS